MKNRIKIFVRHFGIDYLSLLFVSDIFAFCFFTFVFAFCVNYQLVLAFKQHRPSNPDFEMSVF